MSETTIDKVITGHDLTFTLDFQRDDESGWFVVHVVELPGCVSQGATLEEAKVNVADALESYMEVLLENAIKRQLGESASISGEPLSETTKMLVRPKFEVRA